MSTVIDSLERAQLRRVPRFQAGDRLKVHFQVVEGTRRRTQVFEGVVIKRQGEGVRETFTVRKQSFGVGVERTFPVHSPKIERIEVSARGDVRRAKLYYLRGRVGKRARVRERRYTGQAEEVVQAGLLHDPAAEAAAAADSEVPGEAVDAQAIDEATRDGRHRGDRRRHRRPPAPSCPPPGSSASGSLLELVLIVAVALGLALGIQAFLIKPYKIPSESMVPTLEIGQRVLVNRIGARFSDPDVGDVVVFHPPAGAEQDDMCGGAAAGRPGLPEADAGEGRRELHQARRRGPRRPAPDPQRPCDPQRQAPEGAVHPPCAGSDGCDYPREVTIPAGHYFMMGDNRGSSDDSRFWGPVPKKWIIGAAFGTYWPPKRVGLL